MYIFSLIPATNSHLRSHSPTPSPLSNWKTFPTLDPVPSSVCKQPWGKEAKRMLCICLGSEGDRESRDLIGRLNVPLARLSHVAPPACKGHWDISHNLPFQGQTLASDLHFDARTTDLHGRTAAWISPRDEEVEIKRKYSL